MSTPAGPTPSLLARLSPAQPLALPAPSTEEAAKKRSRRGGNRDPAAALSSSSSVSPPAPRWAPTAAIPTLVAGAARSRWASPRALAARAAQDASTSAQVQQQDEVQVGLAHLAIAPLPTNGHRDPPLGLPISGVATKQPVLGGRSRWDTAGLAADLAAQVPAPPTVPTPAPAVVPTPVILPAIKPALLSPTRTKAVPPAFPSPTKSINWADEDDEDGSLPELDEDWAVPTPAETFVYHTSPIAKPIPAVPLVPVLARPFARVQQSPRIPPPQPQARSPRQRHPPSPRLPVPASATPAKVFAPTSPPLLKARQPPPHLRKALDVSAPTPRSFRPAVQSAPPPPPPPAARPAVPPSAVFARLSGITKSRPNGDWRATS